MASRRQIRIVVLCVFLIMVAVAVTAFPRFVHEHRSQNWPTTQGVVTRVDAHLGYSGRGAISGYVPEVDYVYAVAGKEYVGRRITFHSLDHLLTRTGAEQVLRPYAVARPVTVFYDAGRPEDSVLEPGLQPEQRFLAWACVAYFAVGTVGALLTGLGLRRTA